LRYPLPQLATDQPGGVEPLDGDALAAVDNGTTERTLEECPPERAALQFLDQGRSEPAERGVAA